MEELLSKVRSLPEIELLEFIQGLGDHLTKNKMEHLIDQVFEVGEEELSEMQNKVNNLEEEISSLEDSRDEWRSTCETAARKLEDIKKILQ